MQVFKNPVGRPPKDLKKKRIITVVVIALIIFLGGSITIMNIMGMDMTSLMGNSIISQQKRVVCGDVNNDGRVDNRDYLELKEYIIDNNDVPKNLINGDVNLNGKINNLDLAQLKSYIEKPKGMYSIKYKSTGTMGSMPNEVRVLGGVKIELPTNLYIKQGYEFINWKDNKGKKYKDEQIVVIDSNIVLTPVWKKSNKSYVKVTFNPNGGSVNPVSKIIEVGSSYGELPVPVRQNYLFKGWFTSSKGGSQIVSTTILNKKINANITLYAKWEKAPISEKLRMTFDADGGNVNPTYIMVNYDEKIGSLPTPTKVDYKFAGWYTEKNGRGTLVTEETVYKRKSGITLYAKWEKTNILILGASNITRLKTHGVLPFDLITNNVVYRSGGTLDWEISNESEFNPDLAKANSRSSQKGGLYEMIEKINNLTTDASNGKNYYVLYYMTGNTVKTYGNTDELVKENGGEDYTKYNDVAKTIKEKFPNYNIKFYVVGLGAVDCNASSKKDDVLCDGDVNEYKKKKRSNNKYLAYEAGFNEQFQNNVSNTYINGFISTIGFIKGNFNPLADKMEDDGIHYNKIGTGDIYNYVKGQIDYN